MASYLNLIDYIALVLYTVYLGSALIGVWVLWRSTRKLRILGWALLIESAGAAVILTLMSSKYWITGGAGIIAISIGPLVEMILNIVIPVSIGAVIVLAAAYLVSRLLKGGYAVIGALVPCLLIPTIFSISARELIILTDRGKPVLVDTTREIKIASGFSITPFIDEPANNPTSIVFGPENTLYVANYNGDIWGISTKDGTSWRYATGLKVPVGLAWHENLLYVASHGKVSVLHDQNGDNVADEIRDIVTGLPARLYPWHANNGIVFGPDDRIYFAVGSTTDAAVEPYQYAAEVLSVNPDGSDLRTFATGVRNPYRLAFNSQGDLFGTDNGPDGFEDTPGDELNHLVEGADYGFPKYFAFPPPDSNTMAPIAVFPPHASADGLIFYQGDQFPQEYYDNAFVSLWHLGEIYRIQLTKDENGNYSARPSLFITGFHNPLDFAVGPDGNLYVIDFATSIIYKVSYMGEN